MIWMLDQVRLQMGLVVSSEFLKLALCTSESAIASLVATDLWISQDRRTCNSVH